jgi:polyisoprenoid-binding protein YceI
MQTAPTAKTYAIDPAHSEVGFSIRHMMVSKVTGHFNGFTGTIGIAEDGDTPTDLNAAIDAGSINTRNEKRDGHLKNADFFETDTHAQITFKSTSITRTGNAFTAVGDLTLHGVTKSVTLTGEVGGHVKDPWGNDRVGYTAKGSIVRKDFGLNFQTPLEGGGFMLGDNVDLDLAIEATPQK